MPLSPFSRAIREANEIIRRCHITQPQHIQLKEIAALHNVFLQEREIEGADARVQVYENQGLVTVNRGIPERGRRRFAFAHEIGHFVLHRSKYRSRACTEYEFLKWYRSNEEEPEANVFAAELLMPEDMFKNKSVGMPPGFESIKELSMVFDTSLTSTAIRYVEKGPNPCALIASKGGKISWFWTSPDFNHRIFGPGTNVEDSSCAGEYFSKSIMSLGKPTPVIDVCWIQTDTPGRLKILEDAFIMPQYGIVLSLIWEK